MRLCIFVYRANLRIECTAPGVAWREWVQRQAPDLRDTWIHLIRERALYANINRRWEIRD